MSSQTSEIFDVIIIGAGQTGLAAGYLLSEHKINYIIFERGSIAESWISQRWDSLTLDTPGWMIDMPGISQAPDMASRFIKGKEYRELLKNFALTNELRVREYHQVIMLDKDDKTGLFNLITDHNGTQKKWLSRKVIIASGSQNEPRIPAISKDLPASVKQFHSSAYRNPNQLPQGSTLIVGSGKSGCQIAEELSATPRKVYLSTSKVGRIPRRYRGRDMSEWLVDSGFFDTETRNVKDPSQLTARVPLISGVGRLGHTLSLQGLHRDGVTLLGRFLGLTNGKLLFGNDTAENIQFGDQVSARLKGMVENYISSAGIDAISAEPDEADVPDPDAVSASAITKLDIHDDEITAVIWATGVRGNFSYVRLPIFDQQSQLVHEEGRSPIKGLFFLGFAWLRKIKSAQVLGIREDAEYIVRELLES